MIGYTLKPILELIPQALDLVKQASIEADYPTDSKDSCIASGLAVAYKTRISGQVVDHDDMIKVAGAIQAYNVTNVVNDLTMQMVEANSQRLVKQASAQTSDSFMEKQAMWQGDLSGFTDLEKITKEAQALMEEAACLGLGQELISKELQMYSGNAYLSKEAALGALGARFYASKDDTFLKLAAALGKEKDIIPPGSLLRNLCSTVTGLDKKAGLIEKGFNFYKETLITKEAAQNSLLVKIAGQNYPLQKVLALPSNYVDDYLGKGFMKEANADPGSAKALIESLPLDSQQLLATVLKNC